MISAQEWIEKNYSHESRSEIKEIYLNEPNLEGELDLGEFTYWDLKVLISLRIDKTKITLKNLSKGTKIVKLVDAQEYINKKYPTQEEKKEVKWLRINDKNLEGDLDLSEFVNLKILDGWGNKLTSLRPSQRWPPREEANIRPWLDDSQPPSQPRGHAACRTGRTPDICVSHRLGW